MVFTIQWLLLQQQLRNLFYRGAVRLQSKAAWLVSVHGSKISDEGGDAKQFLLLCSVRSTREGEQAASPSAPPVCVSFVASRA